MHRKSESQYDLLTLQDLHTSAELIFHCMRQEQHAFCDVLIESCSLLRLFDLLALIPGGNQDLGQRYV